jgi:hypothetical protein
MAKDSKPEARIFFVDNRFPRMARRPGGIPRHQAISNAQAQIDGLKQDFDNWLDPELIEFSAEILQAEQNPGAAQFLDNAFRRCCQLRDVGETMGYALVSFIANNLCDILEALKAGAPYDKDLIDLHISALFLARTERYRGLRPDQVPEMTAGLQRVAKIAGKAPRQKK